MYKKKIIYLTTFPNKKNSGIFYRQSFNKFDQYYFKEYFFDFKIKNIFKLFKKILILKKSLTTKDIIHAQFGSTCGLIGIIFNNKKIITIRGSDILRSKNYFNFKSIIKNFITMRYLHYYNTIIVVSEEIKNKIIKKRPELKKKIIVLPSPVDKNLFYNIEKNKAKKRLNLREHKKYIFFPVYDNHSKNKNFKFIKSLEQKLKKLNIKILYANNKINHHEMLYYYNASECIVLISDYEGWPNVIKESLFCSTPVISTDVSDIKLLSQKTKFIKIIKKLDSDIIIQKILDIISYGKTNNLQKYIYKFELQFYIEKLSKIYFDFHFKNKKILHLHEKNIQNRLKWIENFLSERIGHKWSLKQINNKLILKLRGKNGQIVFDNLNSEFMEFSSSFGVSYWNPKKEGFRSKLNKNLILIGYKRSKNKLINKCKNYHVIDYDILGFTFWMLNRLEEVNSIYIDKFDRFNLKFSHGYKYGYYYRPVVDEWIDILSQVIVNQWPNLILKSNKFKINISSDIDRPSRFLFHNLLTHLKLTFRDLLTGKFYLIFKTIKYNFFSKKINQLTEDDPYNTFDWLLSLPIKVKFYFLFGKSNYIHDSFYSTDHHIIKNLIKNIIIKKREIGIHYSFNCMQNLKQLKIEHNNFLKLQKKINLNYNFKVTSRMHYLRFKHPYTLSVLDKLKVDVDESYGNSADICFRTGTCHDFTAFDPIKNKNLNIRISPLILMDNALKGKSNLQKLSIINQTKNIVRKFEGNFNILFHNNNIHENKKIIESLCEKQ